MSGFDTVKKTMCFLKTYLLQVQSCWFGHALVFPTYGFGNWVGTARDVLTSINCKTFIISLRIPWRKLLVLPFKLLIPVMNIQYKLLLYLSHSGFCKEKSWFKKEKSKYYLYFVASSANHGCDATEKYCFIKRSFRSQGLAIESLVAIQLLFPAKTCFGNRENNYLQFQVFSGYRVLLPRPNWTDESKTKIYFCKNSKNELITKI